MTKNGKMIMEIIEESNDHPTAEQIFLKAKERAPKIVLATIYNNLNRLVAKKLIRRIVLNGSPDRYDHMGRHDHMICNECGRLTDIHLEDISGKLEREVGSPILSYDLNIHHVCSECMKQKSRVES